MKIVILTNNDIGLYQFRRELIKQLLDENEVILSLPNGNWVSQFQKMGCTFVETPLERRGVNPLRDFSLFTRYLALLKAHRPDLVITYTIKPNIYGGLACRCLRLPYVANVTGLGTAFQKRGLLRSFATFLYKVGLKKAHTLFFENAENQDRFLKSKICTSEQAFLLNGAGVNLAHYSPLPYPNNSSPTKFLFSGRLMREKGIDELFEAMRRLQTEGIACTLDIIGEYEEDYQTQIEKYVAEGWLQYHGYQEDVRPFIQNAHCFVLPSWHEGMANTNLESAACARPIITSNIHGCKEAVLDGVSGYLVEKQNVDSLYNALKTFINLPYEEKKQMGLNGRKHMEAVFDKKDVVQLTLERLMKGMISYENI